MKKFLEKTSRLLRGKGKGADYECFDVTNEDNCIYSKVTIAFLGYPQGVTSEETRFLEDAFALAFATVSEMTCNSENRFRRLSQVIIHEIVNDTEPDEGNEVQFLIEFEVLQTCNGCSEYPRLFTLGDDGKSPNRNLKEKKRKTNRKGKGGGESKSTRKSKHIKKNGVIENKIKGKGRIKRSGKGKGKGKTNCSRGTKNGKGKGKGNGRDDTCPPPSERGFMSFLQSLVKEHIDEGLLVNIVDILDFSLTVESTKVVSCGSPVDNPTIPVTHNPTIFQSPSSQPTSPSAALTPTNAPSALSSITRSQLPSSSPTICDSTVATDLDFFNADLTRNTLHEAEGELRYEKIGTHGEQVIDLVVTVAPGTSYTTDVPENNGKSGDFGQINIRNLFTPDLNGIGNFEFCLYEHGSPSQTVEIDSFRFSIFDIDNRNQLKERVLVDSNQFSNYFLDPNTEIEVNCEGEEGLPPSCDSTFIFETDQGGNVDNPKNKDALTLEQLKRSVSFTFRQTSCFQMTFQLYCPMDYNCTAETGGNFIFAGTAQGLVDECNEFPVRRKLGASSILPDPISNQTFLGGLCLLVIFGLMLWRSTSTFPH